jgi:hypothetical protein
MATNFPGGIDTFVNPNATSSLDSPSHAGLHTDLADGMTAVQTELVNNPYGLIHLNTTNFSAVSIISIPDNTFSATYKNYRILVTLTAGSTADGLRYRFRASGSDNTTSNYYNAFGGVLTNGTTFTDFVSADTKGLLTWSPSNFGVTGVVLDLFQPFESTKTMYTFQSHRITSATATRSFEGIGYFNGTTSFDSFTIFPDAGNITGRISIYGVKEQ